MAQLYIQKNAQPDTWVMSGAPTATTLFLSLPATINYSGDPSHPDTLPANVLAVLPDATSVFDRTNDVYVGYTVKGSNVLSVIKESLLPTLTSDYAPICRVELHGIKPYQPEPYLAGGGLGVAPVTTSVVSAAGAERVFVLGSEPASWQQTSFDDSAWSSSVALVGSEGGFYATAPGGAWVTAHTGVLGSDLHFLLRRDFALAAGTITSARLTINVDDELLTAPELYVNGTSVGALFVRDFSGLPVGYATINLDTALLLPGAANSLALAGASFAGGLSAVSYALSVVQGPATATDATTAEGDLLYRHAGALAPLHIGPTGDVLTSDGADPYWAAPAASGTVTSVGVAAPSPLAASGGPVTTSGTITLSWATGQTANRVLASPNGSSGAVSLRALVGNDIPVDASTIVSSAGVIKGNYQAGSGVSISGNTISATGSGGTVTSVALSMPGIFSASGSPVTGSGTLAVTLATESANTVFAGPATGSAAPTFRALAAADLPAAPGAGGNVHAHGHFL